MCCEVVVLRYGCAASAEPLPVEGVCWQPVLGLWGLFVLFVVVLVGFLVLCVCLHCF